MAAVLLTTVSGLLVSCGQPSQNGKFSAGSLIAEMGEDKTGAVEALGFDMSQAQLQEMGAEQEYSVSAEIDGAPCTVTLSFYNDIFMGFRYVFSDRETAFACAAQVRGALGEAYGEKTSMPGLSSAQETPGSLSYFDELTDASQIRDSVVYFEDWTPETDPKQMETMLGGRDFSRIDVRFTLQAASPEEGGGDYAAVAVRYSAIPAAGQGLAEE